MRVHARRRRDAFNHESFLLTCDAPALLRDVLRGALGSRALYFPARHYVEIEAADGAAAADVLAARYGPDVFCVACATTPTCPEWNRCVEGAPPEPRPWGAWAREPPPRPAAQPAPPWGAWAREPPPPPRPTPAPSRAADPVADALRVLNVAAGAPLADRKAAYVRAVLAAHPDTNPAEGSAARLDAVLRARRALGF